MRYHSHIPWKEKELNGSLCKGKWNEVQRKRMITFFKCNLLYKNSVDVLRKTLYNFVCVSAEIELTTNHENF